MTPEQQKAAARVVLNQIRNAERMLLQSCMVINQLIGTGYVTDELLDLFVEAGGLFERLSTCASACIDNAEQSDKAEE